MNISKTHAIKIIDQITDSRGAGFDDWWINMMDRIGLYDYDTDSWPSIYDVFEALGISETEVRQVLGHSTL